LLVLEDLSDARCRRFLAAAAADAAAGDLSVLLAVRQQLSS